MRASTNNQRIMQTGYEAAKNKSKVLERFALDGTEWKEYVRERDSRKRTLTPVPEFIQVQGQSAPAQEDIRRYLKRFTGKPLDAGKLDPALTRLTGGGRYATLCYRIV